MRNSKIKWQEGGVKMAVRKGKVVMTISMREESAKAIQMFADALKMNKSNFIEDVVMTFIGDVAKAQANRRKQEKAKKGRA